MKIFKIALLMAIMPFLSPLNAAAVTWNGSQDSDWENDNNWTPASYPSYSDDVVIPVTGNNPVIGNSVNLPFQCNKLTVNAVPQLVILGTLIYL